jgi:Uma2 family endonuclease
MTILVQDRRDAERIRAERKAAGTDRWDEVWDGVYILMPLPNDEHQEILTQFSAILAVLADLPADSEVRAGVNVSDRENWTKNYRCPDVVVFLPDTSAVNHDTFWLGGPDFAVEVVSPDDRSREKLDFYARVGVRELLLIDREPWSLELYRLHNARLEPAGRSTIEAPEAIRSEVVPLSFRLIPGEDRLRIELAHTTASAGGSSEDLPLPRNAFRCTVPAAHRWADPSPLGERNGMRGVAASGGRLGTAMRRVSLAAAAGILGVLATAALLRPDPRGHGTHTQMGLPPCAFFRLTGDRCPACGMTTAFAWTVRGRVDRAWYANPAGALLAMACPVVALWLIHSAASGRPRWGARSIDGPLIALVVAAVAVGLGAWTLRMIQGRVFG